MGDSYDAADTRPFTGLLTGGFYIIIVIIVQTVFDHQDRGQDLFAKTNQNAATDKQPFTVLWLAGSYRSSLRAHVPLLEISLIPTSQCHNSCSELLKHQQYNSSHLPEHLPFAQRRLLMQKSNKRNNYHMTEHIPTSSDIFVVLAFALNHNRCFSFLFNHRQFL